MATMSPAEDLSRSEWKRLKRVAMHMNITVQQLASGELRKCITRYEKQLGIRGKIV